MSWSAFLSLLVHLGIFSKKQRLAMFEDQSMWLYVVNKCDVGDFPVGKGKRVAIEKTRRPLATPTSSRYGEEETYLRLLLDARHYLSGHGLQYAKQIAPRYKKILTRKKFERATEELYRTKSGSSKPSAFNPAAMANARTSNQRRRDKLKKLGFLSLL